MPGNYPDKIRELELYNGQFDAYKLAANGADVLFANYPAGTVIPDHTHDTENYGVVLRGEAVMTIEGETKTYKPGEWYYIPENAVHSFECSVDTDQIELWFKTNN